MIAKNLQPVLGLLLFLSMGMIRAEEPQKPPAPPEGWDKTTPAEPARPRAEKKAETSNGKIFELMQAMFKLNGNAEKTGNSVGLRQGLKDCQDSIDELALKSVEATVVSVSDRTLSVADNFKGGMELFFSGSYSPKLAKLVAGLKKGDRLKFSGEMKTTKTPTHKSFAPWKQQSFSNFNFTSIELIPND